MSDLKTDNLEQKVREIVAEIVEVEPEEVTMDADFVEGLGMDSMQALEIMAAVEKEYKIQIPEEYLGKISNLKSMVEITEEIING